MFAVKIHANLTGKAFGCATLEQAKSLCRTFYPNCTFETIAVACYAIIDGYRVATITEET